MFLPVNVPSYSINEIAVRVMTMKILVRTLPGRYIYIYVQTQ